MEWFSSIEWTNTVSSTYLDGDDKKPILLQFVLDLGLLHFHLRFYAFDSGEIIFEISF